MFDPMLMKPDPRASVNQYVIRAAQQLNGEKVKCIHIRPCQQQKDLVSCGPFCIGYMWALSGGIEPNSYSFTPNDIRRILLDLTEDPCKIKTAIMGRRVQKQLKQIPPVAIVKIPH